MLASPPRRREKLASNWVGIVPPLFYPTRLDGGMTSSPDEPMTPSQDSKPILAFYRDYCQSKGCSHSPADILDCAIEAHALQVLMQRGFHLIRAPPPPGPVEV